MGMQCGLLPSKMGLKRLSLEPQSGEYEARWMFEISLNLHHYVTKDEAQTYHVALQFA